MVPVWALKDFFLFVILAPAFARTGSGGDPVNIVDLLKLDIRPPYRSTEKALLRKRHIHVALLRLRGKDGLT